MFKKIASSLLVFVLILQASIFSGVAFADEYEAYEESSIIYEVEDDTTAEENIAIESDIVEIDPLTNTVTVTTDQQLRSALVRAAGSSVTIVVDNTINMGTHATIQGSGSITVSNHHRHFVVQRTGMNESSLTLAGNITLTRAAGYNGHGGGVRVVGGNNAIPGNTHLTLRDNAAIINNSSQVEGGGVHLNGGTLNLHDNSQIAGNATLGNGGGVSATHGGRCGVNMFGNSSISNNIAVNGGGIVFGALDDFVMHGGRITGNTATNNGGGISALGGTTHLHMINGQITGNTAVNNGGGINAAALGALAIEGNMVFNNNSARVPFDFGLEAGLSAFPFIRWSGNNSIPGTHLLNNYDISFSGEEIATVTFDGNGGTILPQNVQRSVPIGTGLGINMPVNPIHPEGFDFLGWVILGTTTPFTSTTVVPTSITVQAQWDGESTLRHNVTFELNGGTGYFPTQNIVNGSFATAPTTEPTRGGFTFLGWFVGDATTEFNFEATPITAPVTLTARWLGNCGNTDCDCDYCECDEDNCCSDANCTNPDCDCEYCECDADNCCSDANCTNPDCDCEDCDCDADDCCSDINIGGGNGGNNNLPQTGAAVTVIALAGSGLSFIAAGSTLVLKSRKREAL